MSPGSGWTHYQCCQGYCPVCCFKPSDTPHTFPRTCMYLEACCCPGLAASANRFVIMDKYGLMPDPCDNSLIRMNNFLLLARCICDIAAIFDKNLRHAAQILDCLSEVLFWSTLGCMTAQTYAEVQFREQAAACRRLPAHARGLGLRVLRGAQGAERPPAAGIMPPFFCARRVNRAGGVEEAAATSTPSPRHRNG